jgi:uncharacterized protein (PEP-CTERM system associated)
MLIRATRLGFAFPLRRPPPPEPKRAGIGMRGGRAAIRRGRPAGLLVAGPLLTAIAWLAGGTAAQAQQQGLLPATGVDTRVGDLRGYFQQAFGQVAAPEATTHAWTYSAAVDASETYDTDVPVSSGGTSHNAHDLITRITPDLGVTGESSRLTGNLFYSPTLNIYAIHGNQNGVDQNLNGAATLTVIPDLFFIDMRAFAAEEAIAGFNGPAGTTDTGSSNEELTTSFSISPTLRHSFGSVANVQLGYSLARTTFTANNNVAAATAAEVNQNVTTETENASISTGDDFGQFSDVATAQASQSSGSGALSGAYNNTFMDTVTYAATRSLSFTGSIGHEDIFYGGTDPVTIDDVTWSGGLIWAPNPDSNISIGYGHQQGGSSFYLNATYAVSAFTRVYARYSQGVGTEAQNLQVAVANSTVNSSNVVIDPVTHQPVLLNNNFFITQPGLFRTTSASGTVVVVWPRDLFSLGLNYQETTQLTSAVAGAPGSSGSSTGAYATFSWNHDLSEDLHSNAMLQYGVNDNNNTTVGAVNTNQGSFLVNVGLTYTISETLSLSAQYTLTTGDTGIGTTNGVRQIAIISIHKTFF